MSRPMRHFSIEQLQRAINSMQNIAEARIRQAIANPSPFGGDAHDRLYEEDWDNEIEVDAIVEYAQEIFPCYSWCIDALFNHVRDIHIDSLRKDMHQC